METANQTEIMNYKLTAEERYGHEIITRENIPDGVPKDGEWEELTTSHDPGWKGVWKRLSNTSGRTFKQFFHDYEFLVALRRPLPLGNEAGKPPQWRLRGMEEHLWLTDEAFDGPTNRWCQLESESYFAPTVKHFLEIWPETKSIRTRIHATPLAPPPLPEPLPCQCGSQDIVVKHQDADNGIAVCQACGRHGPAEHSSAAAILAWNETAGIPCSANIILESRKSFYCLGCGQPLFCRQCEPEPREQRKPLDLFDSCCREHFKKLGWDVRNLVNDFTVGDLAEWIASLLNGERKLKVYGEWVTEITASGVSDLDGYEVFDVIHKNGYTSRWTGKGIRDDWRDLTAYLRPYPKPSPPPVPEQPCCQEWADEVKRNPCVVNNTKIRYCCYCGKEHPKHA